MITAIIREWSRWLRGRRPKGSPARRPCKPRLDALEARELPAASIPTVVTPSLIGRILVVQGTNNNDVINVIQTGTTIKTAGRSFAAGRIDRIVVVGEQGNDTITISTAITKWTRLFGGTGNDTIRGGSGPDQIYGGWNTDELYGRGGNDILYGGLSPYDKLDGGAGINKLFQRSPNLTQPTSTAIEREIMRLVNVERARVGLPALTFNAQLNKAAVLHAQQMAVRNNMSHTLYGVTLPSMLTRYDFVGYEFTSARENIAYGYPGASAVVQAWMNSPGHRANILATDVKEIGVGVRTSATGHMYFCQNFGTRIGSVDPL